MSRFLPLAVSVSVFAVVAAHKPKSLCVSTSLRLPAWPAEESRKESQTGA